MYTHSTLNTIKALMEHTPSKLIEVLAVLTSNGKGIISDPYYLSCFSCLDSDGEEFGDDSLLQVLRKQRTRVRDQIR